MGDGTVFLINKSSPGFTNADDLLLIPEARTLFPFLLEDRLEAAAAGCSKAPKYLEHTVSGGRLFTVQSLWSTTRKAFKLIGSRDLGTIGNGAFRRVRVGAATFSRVHSISSTYGPN